MTARILIVDDTPANLRLLEAKLTAEYFEVITAADGMSALEIAAAKAPDIILLDIMMPGLDGFEVARCLKSNPNTRHIPIVMVTALTDSTDRVRGLEAGADDFLSKPVNDIALFARVRSLTRLKVMMDELRIRHMATGRFDMTGKDPYGDDGGVITGKVLLVDGVSQTAAQVRGYLDEAGHAVTHVATSAETIALGQSGAFDLVILAHRLIGGGDGLRLCSQLRSQDETRHVPILMILDEGDLTHLAKGLEIGVTDYLVRPFDKNELLARTRTQIRRRRYHDRLRNMLVDSVSLAYTDTLTGVYNRRYMNDHLAHKIAEIGETAKPVSVMIFDLDRFKLINDSYGHPTGDRILKGVAERVGTSIRDIDLLARYGGEEFVVIMPSTPPEIALSVAERLCIRLAEEPFVIPGQSDPLPITASIGVATTTDPAETVEGLLGRADTALYAAKHGGRNQVRAAQESSPTDAGRRSQDAVKSA